MVSGIVLRTGMMRSGVPVPLVLDLLARILLSLRCATVLQRDVTEFTIVLTNLTK